jgi:hypothetical protein
MRRIFRYRYNWSSVIMNGERTFFFNLKSGGGGGWNQGPLDTAAT